MTGLANLSPVARFSFPVVLLEQKATMKSAVAGLTRVQEALAIHPKSGDCGYGSHLKTVLETHRLKNFMLGAKGEIERL